MSPATTQSEELVEPVPPHADKDVLATMVRRRDPDATAYVIGMVRFHRGHVTNAAKAIGITHRVIYKWAAANPEFREALREVAHKKGKRPTVDRKMKPKIWSQRGKKSFTELAEEHGVSVSCISRVMSEEPGLAKPKSLTARQQKTCAARYEKGAELKELAERYGVTTQRMRGMVSKLTKLRKRAPKA